MIMKVTIDERPMDALLVGYENQENLGLRSILAYLQEQGYRAKLVPFLPGRDAEVLEAVQRYRPRLVGFSLIFQYTLEEFANLMSYLRRHGVSAHFTVGGHFPSLRPAETLALLPELDTVVRFEGELTLAELLAHLDQKEQWQEIQGLAFQYNGEVILTSPRPLLTDLDCLPPVYRDEPRRSGSGVPIASMLASRGCLFNCSFCSIRQFYGAAPGPLRRSRSAEAVVAEMSTLYYENGVRLFIFQDDDFAARSPRQRAWLEAFLDELAQTGLADEVRWKISCRVDDLEPKILEKMLEHGLVAVYLGVESGSPIGLHTMNKYVTVDQNLAAVNLLKQYDLALAIGFMLFDPSSTVETVRENLAFLQQVGHDGYFPINFCKMLPYAGTPIEAQLRAAGRLKGTVARPDYDFLDSRLDWYHFLVQRIFTRRNFSRDGLVMLLQQVDFDARLLQSFGRHRLPDGYMTSLRRLTACSNRLALETLETLLDLILTSDIELLLHESQAVLEAADREWRGEIALETALAHLLAGDTAILTLEGIEQVGPANAII
jgi:radical SAM superfamily enzyme YgiQ (UPF0313 family)